MTTKNSILYFIVLSLSSVVFGIYWFDILNFIKENSDMLFNQKGKALLFLVNSVFVYSVTTASLRSKTNWTLKVLHILLAASWTYLLLRHMFTFGLLS
jgi:hypothetical protein